MNKLIAALLMVLFAGLGIGKADDFSVTGLTLDGEIEGENIVFTLSFDADVKANNVSIPVVMGLPGCSLGIGDIAYLDGKLP